MSWPWWRHALLLLAACGSSDQLLFEESEGQHCQGNFSDEAALRLLQRRGLKMYQTKERHGDGAVRISIQNQASPSVIFLVANNPQNTWDKVTIDGVPALQSHQYCKNDPNLKYKCLPPCVFLQHPPCGYDDTPKTFVFYLQPSNSATVTVAPGGIFASFKVWLYPLSAFEAHHDFREVISQGPQSQSLFEGTVDLDTVDIDLSGVDGVTHSLQMSWKPDVGTEDVTACIDLPKPSNGLPITQLPYGYRAVMPDKYHWPGGGQCQCEKYSYHNPACNTDACLSSCPASIANSACGQHRCRKWYQLHTANNRSSFCHWMRSSGCVSYCWPMDEFKCVDDSCGFGGYRQPKEDCSDLLDTCYDGKGGPSCPLSLFRPAQDYWNRYSCGKESNLNSPYDETWWPEVGCVDTKFPNGGTPNRGYRREAGQVNFIFKDYDWLNGA